MLQDSSHDPLLAPATHFASHAWNYRFETLLDTLEGYAQQQHNSQLEWPFYWIDLVIKGPCKQENKKTSGRMVAQSLPPIFRSIMSPSLARSSF